MASYTGLTYDNKKEKLLQQFTRFGLAAKGVVYCLMGLLTVMAALGLSSRKGNKTEAFKMIYDQPFGKVLLIIIAIGLLGYVTLRIFQTFLDSDNKGNDAKGIFTRIGYGVSALLYLGLSIYALKLAIGKSSGGDSKQFFVSKIMEYPGGEWLVGIAALIIIGAGINQIYKGASGKFMEKVRVIKTGFTNTFKKAGIMGYVSRGIVLCIIGYFFLQAALNSNPGEAEDTDGAFDFLQANFGNVLMGIVALGLVAYGIFMFVKARHQSIHLNINNS